MKTPAQRARRRRQEGGFSLIELMVVMAVIVIIGLVGYPAIALLLDRSRLMTYLETATLELQSARQEAIRMRVPVVVQPDLTTSELVFFANVDSDTGLVYQPNTSVPYRTADYEIARLPLMTDYGIDFFVATGDDPTEPTVDGLSAASSGENAFVFQPDGSILDVGAVRISDDNGNLFEIRVEPQATAQVEVLKYRESPPWGGASDFFPAGTHPTTDDPLWAWY